MLLYGDEGLDCRYSAKAIRTAASEAARVLVLDPGKPDSAAVNARRGQRRYRLRIDGASRRIGSPSKRQGALTWLFGRAEALAGLTNRKQRISVDVVDVAVQSVPFLIPHRVDATVVVTYPDVAAADKLEAKIREVLEKEPMKWSFEPLSDRPPMLTSPDRDRLTQRLTAVAEEWELPFSVTSSVTPSVAGLVPEHTPVMSGLGPAGEDLYTSREAVSRVSVVQRTLLLAAYLGSVTE